MSEQPGIIDAENMSADQVVETLKNGPPSDSKKTSWRDKISSLFNRKKPAPDPALDQTIGYLKGEQTEPAPENVYQGEAVTPPSQTKAA